MLQKLKQKLLKRRVSNDLIYKPKEVVFYKDNHNPIVLQTKRLVEVKYNERTRQLTIQELV